MEGSKIENISEIKQNIIEVKKELLNLKIKKHTKQDIKPHLFKNKKRQLAKLHTLITQLTRS